MRGRGTQRGFTYIGILIAVGLLGLALSAVGTEWRFASRRDKEQELLYVGHQYRLALARYRAAGGAALPSRLEDLVTDERGPVPRHLLRKLYRDPMTGQADWELIQSADGQIIGVASTSHAVPIKQDNFDPEDENFKDAHCYCDWKFVFKPRRTARKPVN